MSAFMSRNLLWFRAVHLLRRHRVLYWATALVLLSVTVVSVSTISARADRAREAYGTSVAVVVAQADVAAGALIGPGDVAIADIPRALVPEGSATEAVGRRASAPIVAGEVVVDARLAPFGRSATVARLPEGTRGIAIPIFDAAPPTELGDRVDLIASLDPLGYPDRPGTSIVSADVVVVSTGDTAITVAVPLGDMAAVADAVANGSVMLALSSA